jgi:pimeloyl-ACP methyl ester carboxylesterase
VRRAFVWGVVLLATACAPTGAGADDRLTPCRVDGIRNQVRCGQVSRPLDPAQPEGLKIDVHFVVVPALARRKHSDPVFLLAGGPGQSAISLAGQALGLFQRLGNRRDLVFVDQRGTGRSAPLVCEDTRRLSLAQQADPDQQLQRLARCRNALQQLPYGDLRRFTTTLAMQDLDAVRERLGAERINLVGASYGTRAALEYQRLHPSRVRRLVLDGVAPADMVLPVSLSSDAQAAFDSWLAECAVQIDCARAHPQLRADWARLLAALPKRVTVPHPVTGVSEELTLTREMVLAAVRAPLYSPVLASALPLAISEAVHGRFAALLSLGMPLASRASSRIAEGMHFSVLCAEDVPRTGTAGLGSTPPGADFGDATLRHLQRLCADWPRGAVAPAFYSVAPGSAPALLLSGGLDPATPPRHAQRVAEMLGPTARHVVVSHAGHGVLAIPCMRDVLFRFIDTDADRDALGVDVACATSTPRPLPTLAVSGRRG